MRIKNLLNTGNFPTIGETNSSPSMTIPDQTMSLRELITRYAHGIPLQAKEGLYHGEDDDIPDMRRLDLTERQEYAQKFAEELRQYQTPIQQPQPSHEAENGLKNDSATAVEPIS